MKAVSAAAAPHVANGANTAGRLRSCLDSLQPKLPPTLSATIDHERPSRRAHLIPRRPTTTVTLRYALRDPPIPSPALASPARRHEDAAEDRRQPSVHVRLLCLPVLISCRVSDLRGPRCASSRSAVAAASVACMIPRPAPHASGQHLHDYILLPYHLVIVDNTVAKLLLRSHEMLSNQT